jgi:hypothetical protein
VSGGPIPITAIWEYVDRYELGELFVSKIQSMDRDFLKRMQENGANKKANN